MATKKAEGKQEKLDTIEQEFFVDLTSEELRARGDELAVLIQEISQAKEEQKEAAKDMKGKIAIQEILKNKLADTIRQRREPRTLPVDIVAVNGRARLIRVDTGEIVGERALTDREQQRLLPQIGGLTGAPPSPIGSGTATS